MNREEAIARIKDHIEIHKLYEKNAVKITEALEMAIKTLEQKPNGDLISRQALINQLDEYVLDETTNMKGDSVREVIEDLPSVQPEPLTESEVIICKLYLECKAAGSESCNEYKLIMDLLDGKRAVHPEQKKGKWIRVEGMNERCSVCNQYFPVSYFKYRPFEINFCPNCGADMRGDSDGSN